MVEHEKSLFSLYDKNVLIVFLQVIMDFEVVAPFNCVNVRNSVQLSQAPKTRPSLKMIQKWLVVERRFVTRKDIGIKVTQHNSKPMKLRYAASGIFTPP